MAPSERCQGGRRRGARSLTRVGQACGRGRCRAVGEGELVLVGLKLGGVKFARGERGLLVLVPVPKRGGGVVGR